MSTDRKYKIGEAASILKLKSYVLRFWETEFPQLEPKRTDKGQRYYTEEDLELLRRIRYLLHERGLTIEGARRLLQENVRHNDVHASLLPPSSPAAPPPSHGTQFLPGMEPAEPFGRTPAPASPTLPSSEHAGITALDASVAVQPSARERHLEALLQETLQELKALQALLSADRGPIE